MSVKYVIRDHHETREFYLTQEDSNQVILWCKNLSNGDSARVLSIFDGYLYRFDSIPDSIGLQLTNEGQITERE